MTSRWHRGLRAARGLEAALCTVARASELSAPGRRQRDESEEAGCRKEESKPAERDPLVPQGTPEQLLQYIESLTEQRPVDGSCRHRRVSRQDGAALLTAADRILAGKVTDEQAGEAIQIKIQALSA